jgi:hypothetical protein
MSSEAKGKSAARRRGFAEADVDALVAEREDDLNASIKKARSEIQKGIHSRRSVKEIAADGAKRIRQQQRLKSR